MASRQKSAAHTDESIFKVECKLRFWGEISFFLKFFLNTLFPELLRVYLEIIPTIISMYSN